jgi:hypothetical protein
VQKLAQLPQAGGAIAGLPVALIAVAEEDMLQVLGHVYLSCSSSSSSNSSDVVVDVEELCVIPHLQVSLLPRCAAPPLVTV